MECIPGSQQQVPPLRVRPPQRQRRRGMADAPVGMTKCWEAAESYCPQKTTRRADLPRRVSHLSRWWNLIQAEINLDIDLDGDSLAIFLGRLKTPLPHGFNGLLIQTHAQRT